jgi:preprotein translocase subunit YajC
VTQLLLGIGQAQGQSPAPGGALGSFLPLVLMLGVFYFLIIMPQSKKAKQHQKMLSELKKGDDVVTSGGILGRITDIREDVLTINVDDGVKLRVQRSAVSGRQRTSTEAEAAKPSS